MTAIEKTSEWRQALHNGLREAEPPVLLMCYAQMTADLEYAKAFKPYIRKVRDYADNIPQEMLDGLYDRLENLMVEGNYRLDVSLSQQALKELMDICVGEEVDQAYVPMLMEDMGYDTDDILRKPQGLSVADQYPSDFKVVIVGGGFGGICAAIYCKRAGIDFVLLEKNPAAGGTWWENIYPNCGVDAPNHLYSYSFNLKHDWTRYFVRQGEIQSYIADCVEKYDLGSHIRFETKVDRAVFNEASESWTVEAQSPNGELITLHANSVIISCGQLNNPKVPNFKGKDSFTGPAFHTARWDPSVDLSGKRVALVGVGASSVQVGPGIVDKVGALTIYQRSAQWINQRANYDRVVTEGVRWILEHLPFYARWYRFQLLWAFSDAVYPALRVDPEWKGDGGSINAFSENMRQLMLSYMRNALEGRPDLIEKSTPDFPPYSKRPLFDNRWFETLKKDHVNLVRGGIEEITPEGILDTNGDFTPVDVIIYATGFHANKMIPSIEVVGRNGHTIRGDWGDDNPKAHLGITVPHYPNLFLIYGPNTNYAHGGSIVFNIECQVRYIMKCLQSLGANGADLMEVRSEAYEAYNAEIEDRLSRMIWTQEGISTWYKNSANRVITNSPYTMREYWSETHDVRPEDFIFIKAKSAAA